MARFDFKQPSASDTHMQFLNHDVLYQIIDEINYTYSDKERQAALCSLSLVCRGVYEGTKPALFASVRWPHPDKHDEESGLHFFPDELLRYFKYFHLDWPDHWPDCSPPLWGTLHTGTLHSGIYTPLHLDKLEVALVKMSNIHTFQMTCPFYPPTTLLRALVGCSNIKDLRITDTPFNQGLLPNTLPPDFNLERFTFMPVGEASRVGEGPHDKKYHDLSYYTREYRKRYWNDSRGEFSARSLPGWSARHLFSLTRTDSLKYMQISGKYCALSDFTGLWWVNLETLVLTGPEPAVHEVVLFSDVVRQMPKLQDLRVLFSENAGSVITNAPSFHLAPWGRNSLDPLKPSPDLVLGQIKHLAVSTMCNIDRTFDCVLSLERLACLAIINHPRLPVALSIWRIRDMFDNMKANGSGRSLKVLRLMMEDALEVSLFEELHEACPSLEVLEVERCGYREGDVGFEWTDYGDAFENYKHLRRLRIGIPFEPCDEHENDPAEFLRADRRDCGIYIAARVPSLERIGFEYRSRASGQSHYEDRWLDFDIERHSDGMVTLHELPLSWYPFPDVWEPVEWHQ